MNDNFQERKKVSQLYMFDREGRFPYDPTSIVTSYNDLQNIINDSTKIYPGQTIALADDITLNGITVAPSDRQHQGLYWVTNGDNKGQAKFTTYKLATTYDNNISYDRIWNTVKIAYTKTFEPWASYITTFNNIVVKYATNTINNTINPALFGENWKKQSWQNNSDSIAYRVSYLWITTVPALNDLHKYVWKTLTPDFTNLKYIVNESLAPDLVYLDTYVRGTITPSLSAAITYEEATRNMLLASLPDMPYYEPKYSDFNFSYADSNGNNLNFTSTYSNNTTYHYFTVEYGAYLPDIKQFNLKFNWKNTVPFIKADQALYTYIKKYSKLPDNVNLSHLGYTNVIGSQTMNTGGSFYASWSVCVTLFPSQETSTFYISTRSDAISSSAPNASISSIGQYDNGVSRLTNNRPYYFNISDNSGTVKQENTMMPLLTYRDDHINFKGIKPIAELNAIIYYSAPQKTFYESLANKNIFIESTSNMWSTEMYALKSNNNINVHQIINIYSGFKVYYGLFNLSSNVLNTGTNYADIIKYIINSGTKPSSLNKSLLKNTLVTYASDSGLPRNLTTKYFGSSEIGVGSWGENTGRNCCFIGFPTKFFKYNELNTNLNQVFEGKFSGTGSWGTFGADGTDLQNYIIDNVAIKSSSGYTVNYTFIIAKTTLVFKFGGSSSSGYGLRLTCQQTNLNTCGEL